MRPIISLLALLSSPALGSATSLVAISNNADGLNDAPAGSGTLVRFSPHDGAHLGEHIVTRSGVAMAWDAHSERALAVQHHDGGAQLLVEVDPQTLAITREIGTLVDADDAEILHRVTALTLDDDGNLWGIAARRTFIGGIPVPVGLLVRIEPETAVAEQIGSLGFGVFSRGAAYHDGNLILVNNTDRTDHDLYAWRVDLTDASTTRLGFTGVTGRAVGAGHDDEGKIWAVLGDETSGIYDLDPIDGTTTLLYETGYANLSGLAWVRELWVRRLLPAAGKPTADHVAGALAIAPAAVAEARIGAVGGRRTFELGVGRVTAAPEHTDDYTWISGEPVPFQISWHAGDDVFTFILDDRELTMPPHGAGRDLTVRARAVVPGSVVTVTDLELDGVAIDEELRAVGDGGESGLDILHMHTRWLDDGFVLTGTLTMSWDPRRTPRNSQLAVQLGWGDARAAWR